MQIPFVGASYSGRSPYWDGEECINLYVETQDQGEKAKTPSALYGTPGMVPFAKLQSGGGQVRPGGMLAANGNIYTVCESNVYQVTPGGVSTLLGAISTSTGAVSMADNSFEFCLVDGTKQGFLYTYSNASFFQIEDPQFLDQGSSHVDFIDGYFLHVSPDSQEFYLSNLYDGSTFDATQFAAKEGAPDRLATTAVNHRQVWLLGERTCEVWYDSAAYTTSLTAFPFSRIDGVFVEMGCSAPATVGHIDNTIIWLTDKGTVVRANGYIPQVISTRAIEYKIQSYAPYSDAFAMTYIQEGHWFYAITFPSNFGETWVYDVTTEMWHQRRSNAMKTWRPSACATLNSVVYVGDHTGQIYTLSMDAFTDAGQPIERVRTAQPICSEQKYIMANMLRVDFEFGNAMIPIRFDPVTGLPVAAQIGLSWTDDGGHKWSNEYWQSMGTPGQFKMKVDWHRMGAFRTRSYRIRITDPVKVAIVGAYLDSGQGKQS